MADPLDAPSIRKPVGILAMLLMIVVWAIVVASASETLAGLAWPIQAAFYTVTGLIWILPLKPLLRWMEVGKWRE